MTTHSVNPGAVARTARPIHRRVHRRVRRTGLIACLYRASGWHHEEVEQAAHEPLQPLDRTSA